MIDPCCGSGSGVIAALRLGHNAAGLDVSPQQVKAARARVVQFGKDEVCQPSSELCNVVLLKQYSAVATLFDLVGSAANPLFDKL